MAELLFDFCRGAYGAGDFFADECSMALAQVLLSRYGVLTREAVHAEGIAGGFAAVYDVLKAMEESGRVRRGYFVAGLGATQFALPGADERLRALRDPPEEPQTSVLAATDPANPYGAMLPWPARGADGEGARPQRSAGAHVVLVGGEITAWLGRGEQNLLTFLPAEEPERTRRGRALANALARLVDSGRRRALLVARVDGEPVHFGTSHGDVSWVMFADAGRGWLVGDTTQEMTYASDRIPPTSTFRTDAGLGLEFGSFGIYAAKPMSASKEPINYFVRLRHRF